MSYLGALFYIIAAVVVASTVAAITRRNLVHAVVYLIFSYFGTAMLFYLFGAPLLAALEVIIYAGAIMVLFLFVVMMIKVEGHEETFFPRSQWLPAALFALIYIAAGLLMIFKGPGFPGGETRLDLLWATPRDFGLYVLQNHWFSIEVVSMLLLVAIIGAAFLGKVREKKSVEEKA